MQTIKNYEAFNTYIRQPIAVIHAKTKKCNVCVSVGAQLENLGTRFPGIPIREIYLEEIPLFQGQHLVFTVPTVIVFSEGKEILRESRFIDFKRIEKLFNAYADA